MAGPKPKFTPERQRKFLLAFRESGIVLTGCEAAKVSRQMVYRLRAEDDVFAGLFAAAEEHAADKLEREARRRGEEGWLRPAISGGKVLLDKDSNPVMLREYSDRLMELLLKGRRPAVFRERVEHSGDPARPVVVQMLPGDGRL